MKKKKWKINPAYEKAEYEIETQPEKPLTAVPVLSEPTKAQGESPYPSVTSEARESTVRQADPKSVEIGEDFRGGSQKPSGATAADWREACERAQRATDYATMFPGSNSCASQQVYQSPLWQWENRVKPFDRRSSR